VRGEGRRSGAPCNLHLQYRDPVDRLLIAQAMAGPFWLFEAALPLQAFAELAPLGT